MTPEANVEVVRRMFETYSRGDYDEAASCLDPDVVYVHYKARGRGSGIAYDERLFDVYTMRDGLCVRKAEFRDRAEALQAAGTVP